MPEIIGSTYEVIEKLGSGGGGVVYLVRHLRLNKQIVLKADKRKITTPPELLRREVDVLKDLHHPYIPQVYDFFAEGETIYTAMDFVDGESLDKPLKRGERFSQPQVIKWAKQLLEALEYLHSPTHGTPPRGYVHSDIKPANLMRKANGDICLIDFNISLALGEESVIGASAGYASPEHYGLDFSFCSETATQGTETLPMEENTATLTLPSGTSKRKRIVPDVRSDIYSTGATLYHLLTGRRPAKNATEVIPLSTEEVSPLITRVIRKAMEPNADLRYQTAAEMLWDLEHLREKDPRTKHLKRCKSIAAGVLVPLFILGGAMTFAGLRLMEREQAAARALAERAEQALAAVSESESAYSCGDVPTAVQKAAEAARMDSPYTAQAQKALTDALGVYNLSDGFHPHLSLPLSGTPLKTVLSPRGNRAAVMANGQAMFFDTESGVQLAALPAEPSALADIVFLTEDTVLYAGVGALRAYDLAAQKELWIGKAATSIALSADGSTAAAVYKDENVAAVYDAHTGEALRAVSFQEKRQSVIPNDVFADPEDNLFVLSGAGQWLAVSFSDGSLRVFDLQDGEGDLEIFEATDYTHFEGGFYGSYFAFSASNEEESVFAVIDMEAKAQTGGFSSPNWFHVQTDESGVFVSTENLLVQLEPVTGEQRELAYADSDIMAFTRNGKYTMVALANGSCAIYDENAECMETHEGACDFLALTETYALMADHNTPYLRLLRLENHSDAQVFAYDREYAHNEARINSDGSTVMLFRYDGFRLYAMDGTLLADTAIPDAAQVYDQQYRREEGYLEVFYNDGTITRYSAANGSLLPTEQGAPPDGTLYEEFLTDHLKITAPLHETPKAYDRENGELIRELEKDDYLAYVTQLDGSILTEYVTAQGERYGLLLNEDCEILAKLPDLCDVTSDGRLVFDDLRGSLRQSRIYSLQELLALAEKS